MSANSTVTAAEVVGDHVLARLEPLRDGRRQDVQQQGVGAAARRLELAGPKRDALLQFLVAARDVAQVLLDVQALTGVRHVEQRRRGVLVEMRHLDHADPVERLERRGDLPVVIGAVDDRVDEGRRAVVYRHEAVVARVLGDDRRRLLDRHARMAAIGGSRSSCISGVSTMPGTKEKTATPESFPISRATVNAMERSAILVARVGAGQGATLVRDHVHDRRRCGARASREQVLDQEERRASVGRERLVPTPPGRGTRAGPRSTWRALLTRMSIGPKAAIACGIIAITSSTTLRSHWMNRA